jgi:hypothetical protein
LAFNFFFLPPVGTFTNRRSAELDRASRLPGRRIHRQQPLGSGAEPAREAIARRTS